MKPHPTADDPRAFTEETLHNPGQFMDGHNSWLRNGFAKGTFLLAGTIQPKLGGAILAHNVSLAEIQEIVKSDPFVSEDIVTAEILEITPSKVAPQMEFMLQQ